MAALDRLIAAEREIFQTSVRRRVSAAAAPDNLGPPTRSMGEMTFLVWNRERLPLPRTVRSRDLMGSMSNPRHFSTEMNLVVVAEDRLPVIPDTLPEEILVPFYLLDPTGHRPAEMLYQPALPFEKAEVVLARLIEATGRTLVFSDLHIAQVAAFHLLSFSERAIIYAVDQDQAFCTVQVNNFLVFLTAEECEVGCYPHRLVTRRILRQMHRYSGLDPQILTDFQEFGVLVDERGRSLRRLSNMMTPNQLPAFPNENPGRRWLFRFKSNNQAVRLPAWGENALERPTQEVLDIFRGYLKLQEDWVEALNKSYKVVRSLVHVSPRALVDRDPACPWKGTMRFQMEFAIENHRAVGLHYEIVSSLFPDRFPRWDVLYRASLRTMELRTQYPTAEQPAGLGVDLFPYQLDTLGFMLQAEQREGMHEQLWERIGDLYYSPCFQQVRGTLDGVIKLPRGGFLCEEVGLGKTIEVLALVRANPAPDDLPAPAPGALRPSRATVVVCPVTIVAQWIQMVERFLVRPTAEVVLYHGSRKTSDVDVLENAEIILTTYETLSKEYQKKVAVDVENDNLPEGVPRRPLPPLYAMQWHRVVFDESHTVRNEHTGKGQGCAHIPSTRRWCLTATPFRDEMSASQDLRAQMGMLHSSLRDVPLTWRSMLYSLGVRHNKEQVRADMPAVPDKQEHIVSVPMNPADRAVYTEALQTVRREYDRVRVLMQETNSPGLYMRYMMSVFAPLRTFCNTGRMPRIPVREDLGTVQEAMIEEGEAPEDECPICFTGMDEPMRTSCRHWFCRACITDWLTAAHGNHKCPLCRQPLQMNQLVRIVRPGEGPAAPSPAAPAGPPADHQPEIHDHKLRILLQRLVELQEREPEAKFLIFSQYRDRLQALQEGLEEREIGFRRIDGSMTLLRRSKAIRDFESNDRVRCMILDVRTASFGLNLTRAHHVLFLDTPTNPAAVRQAVGRAHRTGQRQAVHVHHFVLQDTIEERILREGMTSVGLNEISRLLTA